MSSFDQNRYETAKENAHKLYLSLGSVQCPAIGEVHFNSDGFMHMIFQDDERREKRDWKNQMKRFELFPHVPHVLKSITHCQEYFEIMKSVEIKMNKQRMQAVKIVRYWGFVAIIKNYKRRIKIVVRQIGDGHIHFWSIIPYWTTKHYKDIIQISLAEGNLERD